MTNASLWDMVFGGGGASGDPNTMYITAGLANEMHGLFSAIIPNAASTPPGADFSISVSPTMQTIMAGQNASFMVNITGLNGFNSSVSLSCSGQPLGSNCGFSPAMVTPQSGATANSTMTIATSSAPYRMAGLIKTTLSGRLAKSLTLSGLGLIGLVLVVTSFQTSRLWNVAGGMTVLVIAALIAFATGCGGGNGAMSGTQRGTTTVVVTGSSASATHSATVTLTVQ